MSLILDVRTDTKKADQAITKSVRKTSSDIKKLERTSASASTKMTAGFTKLSQVVGPLGVGVALGGTISLMKSAVTAASNLNESVNAVNVTFGEGSQQILDFGKTAATQIGLANSEFNQLSTVTGALLKTTGKPMKEVANLTIDVGKRAADMASVFNTSVKDALFAFNAGLRGETEPLRRFAIDVTDNTLKQFALSQGITKSITSMSQQEKTLLRLQSIMQQSEGVAGDFQRTQGEFANQSRILTSELEDLQAVLGEKFIPIATQGIKIIREIANEFSDSESTTSQFVDKLQSIGESFLSINPLAKFFVDKLNDMKQTTKEIVSESDPNFIGPLPPPEKAREAVAIVTSGLTAIQIKSLGIQQIQALSAETIRGQLETQQLQTVEAANFAAQMANAQVSDDMLNDALLATQQKMMIIRSLSQDLAGAFFDAATGSANLLDSVKQIAKELAKRAFISFISSLIPGGGLVGGLFGGFFQHGGRPPVGRPSIVGERGPEVFVPDRPGRIVPNNQITNNANSTFNLSFPSVREIDEFTVETVIAPILNRLIRSNQLRLTATDTLELRAT